VDHATLRYDNRTIDIRHVTFNETTSFDEQVHFFRTTDILVSPHGGQLTGLPFMPVCGAVIEIFAKYYLPHFFGSLATSAQLRHGYIAMDYHDDNVYDNNDDDNNDTAAVYEKTEAFDDDQKNDPPPVATTVTAAMRDVTARNAIRNCPVAPPKDLVEDAMRTMIGKWQTCCHRRQSQGRHAHPFVNDDV
jgi:Glycosyltransferase 61